MTIRQSLCRALLPAAALLPLALPAPLHAETAKAAVAAKSAVPLWKVADADTTIYLLPTVHFLTEQTEWFDARIAAALASSGTVVTELPPHVLEDPASQQYVMSIGLLPEGQSLRGQLTTEQRQRYEAVMTKLGVPAEAFDRFEPWFAGMTLAVLPLMQKGYKVDKGVEKTIEAKAPAGASRDALETLEGQMALFDGLPQDAQIAFLMAAVDGSEQIAPTLDAMVAAWHAGDPDKLAAIMNANLTDPKLADRLLHARNRVWADWIDARLDKPGTVFMAVGGGHLAGDHSVQAYLAERGITSARVE